MHIDSHAACVGARRAAQAEEASKAEGVARFWQHAVCQGAVWCCSDTGRCPTCSCSWEALAMIVSRNDCVWKSVAVEAS